MTAAKYQAFRKTLRERDKIMADQIVHKLNAIRSSSDPRKKALVIMNSRQAFPHLYISFDTSCKERAHSSFPRERNKERSYSRPDSLAPVC